MSKVIEVDHRNPIVVTQQGMVSSLGLDAATSAAAARAGLRRVQELDYLRFASLDRRSVEPAVGHSIPIITHGFEGAPRLARLADAALRDLLSRFSIPSRSSPGFYMSMPSCRRHLTGAELIADVESREAFLDDAADPVFSVDEESWSAEVLSLALAWMDLPQGDQVRFVSVSGHTGFSEALAAAVQDLNTRTIDMALVGAVDSLVDERCLRWLKTTGRLKSEANPTGVEPGEAAVFLAIEPQQSAGKRNASPLSWIGTIAFAEDQHCRMTGRQPTGKALGECIRSALGDTASLWLISDHNGEFSRATEFGHSLIRMLNHTKRRLLPTLYPAASFGDTGAASGAVATSLVLSSFMRGYAAAETAVVASTADDTQRSAFSLLQSRVRCYGSQRS